MTTIAERYAQKAQASKQVVPASLPDDRFKSTRFKEAVRKVLNSIGLESNYGNFKLWDKFIDWEAVVANENVYRALCYLKDDRNEVLWDTFVLVRVKASSEAEALKKIDKRVYEFKKWW
ncbi:MAG TPA: hypothetical protein PLP05_00420 [Sedimentisphaerales bacterium]|nr:hypothetical protein [Sedimentisphaerales bacterium]